MNCATHSETAAVAFCRTCGKPLCSNCTRDVRGVVYCEPCLAARLEGTVPPAAFVPPVAPAQAQTGYQQFMDQGLGLKVRPGPASGPNPVVAGILAGFFPFGVGAVYCAQYAKGLAHLLIFVMFIFALNHGGSWDALFGIGLAFFIVYQIIDSIRTARAIQEGLPAPDPYGLAQAFSMGERTGESKNIPAVAIVLIGLGVLFLLHTMNVFEFGIDRFWPLILIFFGGWSLAKQWGMIGGGRVGCPCDRCRMRKLMGPAMLLTIGTLFLLQSLNVVDFDRTWPAILLVVGIVKLLQSNASSAGHVGPYVPAPPIAQQPIVPPPPSSPPPSEPMPSDPGTPSSGEVRNV
jgi:cell wall-active antibiotic response 4TMS protein YvqF/B-box zinc finger protein